MSLQIPELRASKLLLIDRQGRRREASLEMAGISHRRGRIRGTLRRAHLSAVPESLWINLTDGAVDGQLSRSIALTALAIEGPGLRARLDATWVAAEVSEPGPSLGDEARPRRPGATNRPGT